MHIPDGFIAPQMYLPAYGVAAGLWAYGLRRLRRALREETIPRLAVLTAFCFVAMMVMLPLPGGTSAHATGIALLALLFGVWTAFIAVSVVLLIQALLFGAGGVTALPVNALAMGLVGSAAALFAYRSLWRVHEGFALVRCTPSLLNACLLAIGLERGRGRQYLQRDPLPSREDVLDGLEDPYEMIAPQGARVFLYVAWTDEQGAGRLHPIEDLLLDWRTGELLPHRGFLYLGSRFAEVQLGDREALRAAEAQLATLRLELEEVRQARAALGRMRAPERPARFLSKRV